MHGKQIVCFGECMVELSPGGGGKSWQLGFAGDTLNVATYLARLGIRVDYMTALGEDAFSHDMKNAWVSEGIGTSLVLAHPERIPGLYAIRVDENGERSFTYWRESSAARAFFSCRAAGQTLARAASASLLYLSGITLSLFAPPERERIVALAASIRARGGDVVFDTNYRPRGWSSRSEARRAIEAIAPHVSVALPTLEDDVALFDDRDAAHCASRWLRSGVREVAVKLGADGCHVASSDFGEAVPVEKSKAPVDTTGAGDSFNAGYIAARLNGHDLRTAGESGNRLAAAVIGHRGAIIPRVVMPMRIVPALV